MNIKRLVCLLNFPSGIRAGGLAGDLDRMEGGIHSSTLWGGVGCAAARLFNGALADRLLEEGGLSSLLWKRENTYFVPKPLPPFKAQRPEGRKKIKEWSWIPVDNLRDYIYKGQLPTGVSPSLYREERRRSAAVDRRSNSAVPFFHKRIVPFEGVSAVLVADIPMDLIEPFKASINLLGDRGLGGERSSGSGHFSVQYLDGEETPFQGVPPAGQGPCYALGAFLPNEEECHRITQSARLGHTPLGYEISRQRGFVGESSDISKPTVTCLSAGSVLPFLIKGRTIDITPAFASHTVSFNGKPPFLSLENP